MKRTISLLMLMAIAGVSFNQAAAACAGDFVNYAVIADAVVADSAQVTPQVIETIAPDLEAKATILAQAVTRAIETATQVAKEMVGQSDEAVEQAVAQASGAAFADAVQKGTEQLKEVAQAPQIVDPLQSFIDAAVVGKMESLERQEKRAAKAAVPVLERVSATFAQGYNAVKETVHNAIAASTKTAQNAALSIQGAVADVRSQVTVEAIKDAFVQKPAATFIGALVGGYIGYKSLAQDENSVQPVSTARRVVQIAGAATLATVGAVVANNWLNEDYGYVAVAGVGVLGLLNIVEIYNK